MFLYLLSCMCKPSVARILQMCVCCVLTVGGIVHVVYLVLKDAAERRGTNCLALYRCYSSCILGYCIQSESSDYYKLFKLKADRFNALTCTLRLVDRAEGETGEGFLFCLVKFIPAQFRCHSTPHMPLHRLFIVDLMGGRSVWPMRETLDICRFIIVIKLFSVHWSEHDCGNQNAL